MPNTILTTLANMRDTQLEWLNEAADQLEKALTADLPPLEDGMWRSNPDNLDLTVYNTIGPDGFVAIGFYNEVDNNLELKAYPADQMEELALAILSACRTPRDNTTSAPQTA